MSAPKNLTVLVNALANAALCSELNLPIRAGQHLQVAHMFYAENARKWEIAGHAEYTKRAMQAVSCLDRALHLLWDRENTEPDGTLHTP